MHAFELEHIETVANNTALKVRRIK